MEYGQVHSPDELTKETEYQGIHILNWYKNQKSKISRSAMTDAEQLAFFHQIEMSSAFCKKSHWEIMYEAAIHFFEEHGADAKIPDDYMTEEGSLKVWIQSETAVVRGTKPPTRTPEQLEKLAKIGISKDMKSAHEKRWDEQYEILKAFVEDKGRLPFFSVCRKDEYPIAL